MFNIFDLLTCDFTENILKNKVILEDAQIS